MNCELNGSTGRCRQGPKQSAKCERNEATGRCRRKTARKPKKQPPKPKTPKKPKFITDGCAPGKFRNPTTNRCVSKTGPIGKKIFTSNETTVIGGPVSLDYFEFEFQGITRKLLSLGDEHTNYRYQNEKTVVTLPTFLKKIVRQSPHCIDLFVENLVFQRQKLATGKQLTKYSCPLNAVRSEFYGCPYHNFQGRTCPYDNLRYHNWDLRFELPLKSYGPNGTDIQPNKGAFWKSNPYDMVFFEAHTDHSVNQALLSIPKEKIIRYILGLDKKKSDAEDMDVFFEAAFTKLLIQADGEVSKKSFQEYRKQVIKRSFTKLKKHTRFPKNFLLTFIKVYKREIGNDMFGYTTIFTDFYLLCRMFQKYQKKNRGPNKCRQSERCEYMILCAGDSHNRKINAFLKEMFGRTCHRFGTKHEHWNKKIRVDHDIEDSYGYKMFDNVDELIQYYLDD